MSFMCCFDICGCISQFYCCCCIRKRTMPSWNREFDKSVSIIRIVLKHQPIVTRENVDSIRGDETRQKASNQQLPLGLTVAFGNHFDEFHYDYKGMPYEWVYTDGQSVPSFPLPASETNRKFILFLHGGGFVYGGTHFYRHFTLKLAKDTGATVLIINYRRAPEHPYPVPEEDCLAVYQWLSQHINPSNLHIAGDSAGGALAVGVLVRARNLGLPLPKGSILLSPWVDIFDTSRPSFSRYVGIDYMSPMFPGAVAPLYINPRTDEYSAINLDLRGLPPMLIEYGASEMLGDQIHDFIKVAREAGVAVTANRYGDMVHVFQLFYTTGQYQCQQSFDAIRKFITTYEG